MEENFQDKFKPDEILENDTMNVGLNKIKIFDSQTTGSMCSERELRRSVGATDCRDSTLAATERLHNESFKISKGKRDSFFKNEHHYKKSKRWGNYEMTEGKSCVAHLEYDFTRAGPPYLISPVQKEDVESLESQLQSMSVETKTEKKKSLLKKIQRYRQYKTLKSFEK